jgi:hypothetical protein
MPRPASIIVRDIYMPTPASIIVWKVWRYQRRYQKLYIAERQIKVTTILLI